MINLPTGVRVKSGHLYIHYQHNGQRRSEATGLKATQANTREAVKLRRARVEALQFGVEPESEEEFVSGTFAEVAQLCLDSLEVKASTRASYKQLLQDYWMPRLQHRQIAAIKLSTLRKIIRETEWSSHKVMKNAISAVRQVFALAQEDGYRNDNPATELTVKRKRSEKRDPDPYTVEERDKLLEWLEANADVGTYAYFLTAFYTGMRTGELIALTWEDYSDGYLSVSKARVRGEVTTTKTDDNRSVAIPEKVCAVLNELPSRFRQAEIFTNQYGRHYQAGYHLNKKFRAAHEATGIRHRTGPYPWRHTYASIGLTNGLDHAWLAKQLGHSLQMFYGVYAKWIDTSKRDREELAKLV